MKRFVLIRHAKSSWDNAMDIKDRDRPLNTRGVRDAHTMANRLLNKSLVPDLIVSSNGIRALHTAVIMVDEMQLPASYISIQEQLYHCSSMDILRAIQSIPNKYNTLFLYCHNPSINNFAAQFIDGFMENVPTCGCLHFTLESDDWKDFGNGKETFQFFDFPKNKEN